MQNDKLLVDSYKLICYMATSACNLVGEPPLYGPFRLVDASSRLIDTLENAGSVSKKLIEIRKLIEDKKYLVMNDEEAFCAFLNELV